MTVWAALLGGSALVGIFVALMIRKSWAIYVAGALPWTILLGAILYTEYVLPNDSNDASMWPIAQAVGGTIAAVVGVYAYTLARKVLEK